MWSRLACSWPFGLLQPFYRWCCSIVSKHIFGFSNILAISYPLCTLLRSFSNPCYSVLHLIGHAECVRFVKKFNLPLLVGLFLRRYAIKWLCRSKCNSDKNGFPIRRLLGVGDTQRRMLLDVGLLKLVFFWTLNFLMVCYYILSFGLKFFSSIIY